MSQAGPASVDATYAIFAGNVTLGGVIQVDVPRTSLAWLSLNTTYA